jgi:hypothetical protein
MARRPAEDLLVTGRAWWLPRGGGVFTSEPVTFERVGIRGNRPDDTATARATQATAKMNTSRVTGGHAECCAQAGAPVSNGVSNGPGIPDG